MLAAASRLVPLALRFCRQIVPPVVATLIAAGLISAYNRTFADQLQQPEVIRCLKIRYLTIPLSRQRRGVCRSGGRELGTITQSWTTQPRAVAYRPFLGDAGKGVATTMRKPHDA